MTTASDRRQHQRFSLNAGYAPMVIRAMDHGDVVEGMAYDISRGGLRFEGDEPIRPGTQVAVEIELPGEQGHVFAHVNVVWIEDEEDPAPYKMAGVFAGFASELDENRLIGALGTGRFRSAA